jgi:hypothetical protein
MKSKQELLLDAKMERKVRKFIRALNIKIAQQNLPMSELNRRPVYNIKHPAQAVRAIRKSLEESKVPHTYRIAVDTIGISRHIFCLNGLGKVELCVNPVYPDLPKPLSILPESRLQ